MIDNIFNHTEPRYPLAKQEARDIWKKLGDGKIPIVLNDIVKELGIHVKGEQLDCDGICRVDQKGFYLLMYNTSSPTTRQRFTVAHEIGHIVLEHIPIGGDSSQYSYGSQKKEANAFAGELLVPSSDIKTFMKKKDKTIEDIIARYKVSKDTALCAINGNRLLNKLYID